MAMIASVMIYFTVIDAFICASGIILVAMYLYVPTAKLIFNTSSIVAYWRWGMGPSRGDKYLLELPLRQVRMKASVSRALNERQHQIDPCEKGDFMRQPSLLDMF